MKRRPTPTLIISSPLISSATSTVAVRMDKKKEKACYSSEAGMLGDLKSSSERRKMMKKNAETMLRVLPMGLCLAALVIMIKNSETSDYGSVSYDNFGGFKYLVYANGICAGYSILSALLTAVPGSVTNISRAWTFFFFDQVLTYMILAAGAVSVEVLYIAKKGDIDIAWSPACGEYGGFCSKAMAAVGITFAAVACYVVLSVISSFRLFSTYDAPICCPGEVATFPG